MAQLRRSITLDHVMDRWVRQNIHNFSQFVRDRIEDEQMLRSLKTDNTPAPQPPDDESPSPFGGRIRMFERYRNVSNHIAQRWKQDEKPYRCKLQGRWRKWHPTTHVVDAELIPGLDHLNFFREGDHVSATIEPYGYPMECAKALIKYCEERGLTFWIDAESSHAPGACIRIILRAADL